MWHKFWQSSQKTQSDILKALKVHTRTRILENPAEKEDFVNPLLPTFLKAVRYNVLLLFTYESKMVTCKRYITLLNPRYSYFVMILVGF